MNIMFWIQREVEVTRAKWVITSWRHCGHAPGRGNGGRDCPAPEKGWIRLWSRNHSSFFTALQGQLWPLIPGERRHRSDVRTGEDALDQKA